MPPLSELATGRCRATGNQDLEPEGARQVGKWDGSEGELAKDVRVQVNDLFTGLLSPEREPAAGVPGFWQPKT